MNPERPIPAPYAPPTTGAAIDLHLDANEGPGGCVDLAEIAVKVGADAARRYPRPAGLESELAANLGLDPAGVLVTAGGDEAIDRACRAFLGPGREIILPEPTFEMIGRYARLTGARVVPVDWQAADYPVEEVLSRVNDRTAIVAVVSPNNPTGAIASADDLRRIATRAPHAKLLVDLAYTEFANEDLTGTALAAPNAVVIRTFSKAYGLAGLRVGYALGSPGTILAMRGIGSPFPCSGFSLAAASAALRRSAAYLPALVQRIRNEREQLFTLLSELGVKPRRSQANFVLAEFDDAESVWRALAERGIAVRRFRDAAPLENALRITCPGSNHGFRRLCGALREVLTPCSK